MPDQESADNFDQLYQLVNQSAAYRRAVHASASGLPKWLIPFSIIDGALLERIATELRVGASDTFLDLACGAGGPGLWVAERTGASLVGVDFAPSAIDAATALAADRQMSQRAQFVVADATETGLPGASFSAVMSIDALMFINPELVAQEIARVLKPNGTFVMTVAESIVEPFTPTLVRDYGPIFERIGFSIRVHEEPVAHEERQIALYRALIEQSSALQAELGPLAKLLLDEARNGLTRAGATGRRTREALFVAERSV